MKCKDKNCKKNLRADNKSGYCSYHSNLYSQKSKQLRKDYAERVGKLRVKKYNNALRILKNKHKKEFIKIYYNLLEQEDGI